MSTATAKRTKKKPRAKAKPCKKATERDQRVKRARAKIALAVTCSLVLGMLNETERCLEFEQAKHSRQAERVRRWANECLDDDELELGAESLRQARTAVYAVHDALNAYIAGRGPKGIGHYAVAWIALGYMVDEARVRFVESEDIQRRWNFLASTVNTFAAMFLDEAEQDRDYEALAGKAAEHVWSSIFEMPKGSWIRL
jgi:hypothetical protein